MQSTSRDPPVPDYVAELEGQCADCASAFRRSTLARDWMQKFAKPWKAQFRSWRGIELEVVPYLVATHGICDSYVLHHSDCRSVVEPGSLRRGALRIPGSRCAHADEEMYDRSSRPGFGMEVDAT